jgi:hypothetical protein
LFLSFAPPLTMRNVSSPIVNLVGNPTNMYFLEQAMRFLNIYELNPSNWASQGFYKYVCQVLPQLCEYMDVMMADKDPKLNDPVGLLVYLAHFPSGMSLR